MNWETFYLVCFLAGLMLSFVSLLGGMGHFGGHAHLPHVHVPHAGHVPHMHVPHGGAVHGAGMNGGTAASASAGPEVPWWNAFSIMIFLCWFGAAGYLLDEVWQLCRRPGCGDGCNLRTCGRSDSSFSS